MPDSTPTPSFSKFTKLKQDICPECEGKVDKYGDTIEASHC